MYQKFAFKNKAIEPATSTNLTRKSVKKVKEPFKQKLQAL